MLTIKRTAVGFLSLIFIGTVIWSAYLFEAGNKGEAIIVTMGAVVSLIGIIAWIVPEERSHESTH